MADGAGGNDGGGKLLVKGRASPGRKAQNAVVTNGVVTRQGFYKLPQGLVYLQKGEKPSDFAR